jgi:hypothetical protein
MDYIRVIQEVVDAHKEDMPTGVTKRVMEECQKAYNESPELYKLTWTVVDSHAHVEHVEDEEDIANVKLSHKTQTLIVEAVDGLPDHPVYGVPSKMIAHDMPDYGMMLKSWLKLSMPRVMYMGEDSVRIIHSIVP